ncbi:Zinc finger BED domain-containing protein 4 [Merluccius polli]|uniref:Zinc finger BED domain-containing protein 4 n=1 Tax=Merluccius polli TaxID=89951 RepID=A0AA47ML19_MERPO|nr:Zinc finger BED domain-containing protein 4 [Merluccius polli]
MSAVWAHFQIVDHDNSKADCKLCSARVSRGGKESTSFNTSNLIKHLKTHHSAEYTQFANAKVTRQPTLTQVLQKREKMSRDNPRALKITEGIAYFIALDDQPLSAVENIGFRHLLGILEPRYEISSRHYITDTMLPKVFDEVKKHVNDLLRDVSAFSFTTDIWSSSVCPMALLSLTVQWLDNEFTLRQATLQAKPFRGSHTSQAIAGAFDGMLQTWGIPKTSVHVVLRDNAKNMIKGMNDAGLPSLPCAAHTLQLVVHEGILSQRSVADALAIGRKIVGHFKHSPLAYSRLEDIQLQISQPAKRLQQDVQTRWNSTFYMIQSLMQQKRALGVFVSEYELPDNLTAPQWTLLEKTVTVLGSFEELTRKVSSSDATAADVIPAVTVLQRFLSRETDDDHGIKTMKGTLAAAVTRRFSDVEEQPFYSIATLLDPRYKNRFFSNTNTTGNAKEMLMLELLGSSVEEEDHDLQEPPARKPCRDQASSSLDSIFDEIADEGASVLLNRAQLDSTAQLETYLGETTISREDKPLQYWAVNKVRFPTLAKMASRYLSAPCSSVDSERLFSSVSHIVNESRNRITADHAEMILFIKKNLPLILPKSI